MKKIFLVLSIFLMMGCSLNNNPTSKAEELFSKYNILDDDIKDEIGVVINNDELTNEQKERYRKIIEGQYKKLSYEIKDEKLDGNTAIVTTQIEVMDYKKIINEIDNEYISKPTYSVVDYNDDKLTRLESAKDTVVYTLELIVTKDENGKWNLNELTDIDIMKIQGMY